MANYVGLDVSVKEMSICIMDDKGVVAARTDVSTDPDLTPQLISKHASEVERVVHESGIRAIWLTRELEKRGVPIICIDVRLAHKALSARINKSDQGDAEAVAQLARTGWFIQVHIRSEASERESNLARRLMTVPGAGLIVALAYIATLDDENRFRRWIDVCAFLGLTPKRHQSGEMDWAGKIFQRGDDDLRRLSYSAASTLISCTRKPSRLKEWATKLAERKGHKKAAVATSRKNAVILHCLRRNETVFESGMEGAG